MADVHCKECGEPRVHIEDYEDEEKQENLMRSIRMLESFAVCRKCRGLDD